MQKSGNFLENIFENNQDTLKLKRIITTHILLSFWLMLILCLSGFGQSQHTENQADQALRGSGRINRSTLGMEIDIPLGSYPGRGINVPISLSYSSKVWRMEYTHSVPGGIVTGGCRAVNVARYSENAASGWTTSLAAPYIEYSGRDNIFNSEGFPWGSDPSLCDPTAPPSYSQNAYLRRITVHLPSGAAHELRADDTVEVYPPDSNCFDNDPSTPCPYNDPSQQQNWNRVYYATDGSNIKYIEDTTTTPVTYKLLMPDGSFYDFAGQLSQMNLSMVRKATKYSDRNGNFTSYDNQTGIWTDTLGKALSAPIGTSAPNNPTPAGQPIEYSMPGMTGKYKFHWKKLKGETPNESGLTNFSQSLKYLGDKLHLTNNGNWQPIPSGTSSLFNSGYDSYVLAQDLFNPVVLTEIELPTGQSYKFTYDVAGRIEIINYPTGGKEVFVYNVIAPLAASDPGNVSDQTNFGVTNRKLYSTSGQNANYEWNYNVSYVAPSGYKINTTAPDGTINSRILHRGNGACTGCSQGTFGYDNGLTGMPYEELNFSNTGDLVTRKLTNWTLTKLPVWVNNGIGQNGGYVFGNEANWHPRVTHEESFVYDETGNAVSATTRYEYEGDLNQRETPVLVNKSTQYAFVAIAGGGSLAQRDPDDLPEPNPTPIPTPNPASLTPIKINETTYLINDPGYLGVQAYYKNQNMVGLVTASVIKDGVGTVVSRSEMKYDENTFSPAFRGNPTTLRVWDSTKGSYSNPDNYISTRAKFDTYGNQYETIDANGKSTITAFDSTYHVFPISVTTTAPDPSGDHGSNSGFTSRATFDPTTGLPLTTTDANEQTTTMDYDPVTLRPIRVTPPAGAGIAETIYHDEPNNFWTKSRSQIDSDKWVESITYFDGLGRAYKTEQIDSQGNIFVEKEFDAQGRVKRITNPFRLNEAKQWTTNIYDESSRIKEVILADTSKVKTDYGVSITGTIGVTKQITDQAGEKRKGITDVLGRMVRVIEDPDGQDLSTDYTFDTLGNLRKTVQGEQLRYFSYDSLGRLLRAKQPEQEVNTSLALPTADPITGHNQWSVAYSYDDSGNILTTTDARGVSVTGTYDNFNRIKFRNYSDSTPDVSFYYDGKYLDSNDVLQAATGSVKGKTTGIKSSVSKTNYTIFDNLGRLKAHRQITDGQIYPTAYTYSLSGAVIEETYPSGRVVKNVLNNDGELSALQSKKNANAGFFTYAGNVAYNTSGAVEKMRLGNGRWETASYNSRLQITQIGLGITDQSQDLLKLEYSYGNSTQNNGSLREQKITVPNAGQTNGFTAIQTYSYDDLNRLQSANETVSGIQSWKQTFQYDRYGNRRLDATNTTTLAQSNNVTNPNIDPATNRFSAGQNYLYDKSGNLTGDAEGREFLYDAENHQKEVKNAQDQTVGVYLYDGDGKRVKKVSNTETTVFVYNGGGKLVAEYSTQLAQTQQVSYLTQDHLGSPRVITNANGEITGRKDYMAFGEETYSANRISGLGYTDQNDLRKGYTGYEKDDESGLDFAQARYYNASHGRFTSVDPLNGSIAITDPQTFNRYTYGLNSPYKFTDPLGLLPQSAFSDNSCSAENSYDQCGGDSGFWGGSFSDREAEYNRVYGGLSNEIARGLGRYLSIQENGYDPEFERFTGDVRLQILDANGNETYGENFSKPTLDQIESRAEEFNQGIYRNQVRQRLKARGLEGHITLTNSGYGFTFTVNDNPQSQKFVEGMLNDSSKFNSSTSSFYFGFHKQDAKCNVNGACVDYRSIDGKGSDQFVFNRSLRAGYVDTDRFNPRRSLGGFLGHAFLEVLPNTLSGSNSVQGVSFRRFPPYQPRLR